ncbi:hypothetical protein R6Q57_025313 [Mikania cordata]
MSLSVNVNGQSKVPPGFRFHPTEEELLHYYLRKKVASERIDLDVIRDIDLNKLEPWDIKEKCTIGSTPQNDWYFFSHKDKKYPTGTRTNRATAAGFWKATGRDKVIYSSLSRIGMRKTLVFYKGRAPHGQKSDWIMHEYRLDDNTINSQDSVSGSNSCDLTQEDGWVVYRVFKKKNYHKSVESSQRSPSAPSTDSIAQMKSLNKHEGVHDQLLSYIKGTSCKQETDSLANIITTTHDYDPLQQLINPINDRFLHLPRLHSGSSDLISLANFDQDSIFKAHNSMTQSRNHEHLENWSDVDRLVASQLNGQPLIPSTCYDEPNDYMCFSYDQHENHEPPQPSSMAEPKEAAYMSEIDIWSFAQSSSPPDQFYLLSV